MTTDTLLLELIDACAEAGCPVCRLSLKSTQRYLDSVIYEYVNDIGVRDELRAARGYCNEHAWWLAQIRGGSLGVAIIYDDVLRAVARAIGSAPEKRTTRASAGEMLKRARPSTDCPACAHRDVMEGQMIDTLLKHSGDDRLATALSRSAGLCVPHLIGALERVRDGDALRRLVALAQEKLAELHGDLAEFIRKSDYRFSDEGFGEEGDSWRRAIGMASGEKGVR